MTTRFLTKFTEQELRQRLSEADENVHADETELGVAQALRWVLGEEDHCGQKINQEEKSERTEPLAADAISEERRRIKRIVRDHIPDDLDYWLKGSGKSAETFHVLRQKLHHILQRIEKERRDR